MDLNCTIAPAPGARYTKAQLQRELEEAERNRDSPRRGGDTRDGLRNGASSPASVSISVHDETTFLSCVPDGTTVTTLPPSQVLAGAERVDFLPPDLPSAININGGGDNDDGSISTPGEAGCNPQSLDGQQVAGRKIRDCFQL